MRPFTPGSAVIWAGILSTFFIPLISADCEYFILQGAAFRYVATRPSGMEDFWVMLADNATYLENNTPKSPVDGMLSQSMTPAHARSTIDSVACASYTELIVTDGPQQYVIGTQIWYRNLSTSTDSHLSPEKKKQRDNLAASSPSFPSAVGSLEAYHVDSIVTTTGSWQFNATRTLEHVLAENWDSIPLPEDAAPGDPARTPRAALRAAADAYLDLWGANDTAAAVAARVPWGQPCRRLEGSAYTGTGAANDTCAVGIPADAAAQAPNTARRYVVDERVGSVSVLCRFGAMQGAPDSHEFRLEGGRLRWVHTMTVCACGGGAVIGS
jgi:hypothetical protein